ncbi:MAG: polysaccharide biosynthesis C-terminal domain-containing protein [Clostridia bacterium]|nr:polysaccharide biosynthesis C-terminal domain-containing protein [Clostridia bacterium]
MTRRNRFIYNGIVMSTVGILLRGITLAFGVYLSHRIGAEGVGLNTLIMSVYGFALTFATSGISLTVTKLVASHIGEGREEEIRKTLSGAALYSLAFSLAATLVLAGFSGFFATVCIKDARAIMPLQILSLSLIPSAVIGIINGYFVAIRRIGFSSAVSLFGQLMRIALTVLILMGAESGDVEGSVFALCISATLSELSAMLLGLVLFLINIAGAGGRLKGKRGANVKAVAEMALPLSASAYIRSGLLSVEHNIIPERLRKGGQSPSQALSSFGTMHGMALPMITYPMTPLTSFGSLLLPEFAEAEANKNSARLSRIAREAISATLSYSVLCATLMYIFSEDLGYAFYNSYRVGYFISILAPIIPIMYADHVVDSMLKGIGEQVYSMWVNIIDSALSVALVWLLIPVMGIEGYAVVIIVMELFNFFLSLHRLLHRIVLKLDPIRSLLIPLLCAGISAMAVSHLFASGSTLPVWCLVLKLIFTLCMYFALYIPASCLYSKLASRGHKCGNHHSAITEDQKKGASSRTRQ